MQRGPAGKSGKRSMHVVGLFFAGLFAALALGLIRGVSILFSDLLQLDEEQEDTDA
jgi:hypothetical protein